MKKLILLFCSLFAFVSIFAQETERFQILKIRKVKNDCYRLTAKSNGKWVTGDGSVSPIQTENLIRRVMGITSINDGSNHANREYISNPTSLPEHR